MTKRKLTLPMTPNMVAQHLATLQTKNGLALSPNQPNKRRQAYSWTGFRRRTLWEWMSLLLVPLLIGLGTIWVTNRQTDAQNAMSEQLQTSAQTTAQQQRYDDLLRVYRDGIDTLLLSNGLRQSQPGDDVRRIAHSRTLDILRQVDQTRKASVIHYLADLDLIQGTPEIKEGAWQGSQDELHSLFQELRPPLVSLMKADLSGTNLSEVDLRGAGLHQANLSGANLSRANLYWAYLTNANLSGASLNDAFLEGSKVLDEQLKQAKSLQGATMPDGSIHP